MYSSVGPVFDDGDEVEVVPAQIVDDAAAKEQSRHGDQLQAPSFVAPSALEKLKALKSKRDVFSAEIGVVRAKAEAKMKKRALRKLRKSLSEQDAKELLESNDDLLAASLWPSAASKASPETPSGAAKEDSHESDNEDMEDSRRKRPKYNVEELAPYLHINDRFNGIPEPRFDPKTEKERQIEAAIEAGDWDLASRLNEDVAEEEIQSTFEKAASAKAFAEKMEKLRAEKEKRKPTKLRWTFEAKKRWELKRAPH
eukprot:TRINITY_DN6397_c0_g1_i1.p2 TRINITY_DN6397_c0_g1~~TRINITY_DN6397_c0_g1_i1.p2  ORF type:complete len:255 (-),score=62.97 TRINITY_DN6397_c0_g1_i1:1985-2749(-)